MRHVEFMTVSYSSGMNEKIGMRKTPQSAIYQAPGAKGNGGRLTAMMLDRLIQNACRGAKSPTDHTLIHRYHLFFLLRRCQ